MDGKTKIEKRVLAETPEFIYVPKNRTFNGMLEALVTVRQLLKDWQSGEEGNELYKIQKFVFTALQREVDKPHALVDLSHCLMQTCDYPCYSRDVILAFFATRLQYVPDVPIPTSISRKELLTQLTHGFVNKITTQIDIDEEDEGEVVEEVENNAGMAIEEEV